MEDYTCIIKNKIKEIKKTQAIRILFACESGSRAWGFPSSDSDYDVRFIYAHPQKWYLSLQERPDVIELPINKILDINGWDLKKSLKLLIKNNAVLYEWIQSPIVYAENVNFKNRFKEISKDCFSQIAAMHHYLNSAKKHFEKCIESKNVKLKTYFYCLRSTLAAFWIYKEATIPPMELKVLLVLIDKNSHLTNLIYDLLKLKTHQNESYLHTREALLEKFLIETIAVCESKALTLPGSKHDFEALNTFFQEMLKR
jgi:predicted nucleotidyltransferase